LREYSGPSIDYPQEHPVNFDIRTATLADRPAIEKLIAQSARELSTADYRPEQIEGALRGAFGVDTQLIRDGTYFVLWSGETLVGCGGWSWRRTLFGGDSRAERDAAELDPKIDAARIRAFFIHPQYARRGLGRALLQHCESAAQARGFRRYELMATLPGERLYAACGYVHGALVHYAVAENVSIEFITMMKDATYAPVVCNEASEP
jgi:GNAT superfamily N-acetyltransferase